MIFVLMLDVDQVKKFFMKEGGSIAITEAVCLTHKVDISDHSKKVFVDTFTDAIRYKQYLLNISDHSEKVFVDTFTDAIRYKQH